MRRVVAIQHGRPIFNMAASFQVPEEGLDHAAAMPDVPGPEGLPDVRELPREMFEKLPDKLRRFMMHVRPFEFRFVEPTRSPPVVAEPRRHRVDQDHRPASGQHGSAPQCPRVSLGLPAHRDCVAAAWRRYAAGNYSSRLSIMRCGSIARAASTSGCSTRSTARAHRAAAASRWAASSRATASSSRRPRRRAWFESGKDRAIGEADGWPAGIGGSHGQALRRHPRDDRPHAGRARATSSRPRA